MHAYMYTHTHTNPFMVLYMYVCMICTCIHTHKHIILQALRANTYTHIHTYIRTYTGVWGHSMGACTCLLYAAIGGNDNVCGMVLDSPFSALETVITETAAVAKQVCI
jgi:hypothetical protein